MPMDRTSKLIAIFDDDEAMQDSLRDLMEAAGLVARCFGSAEEFLESDFRRKAACLIVNVRMPKMSGLAVAGQAERRGMQCSDHLHYCPWRCQDADSSDERGGSRVPGETVRSSTVAQKGPSCT